MPNDDLFYCRFLDRSRKPGGPKQLNQTGADSLSWTELSSISSALISTKSEPNKPRLASHTAAQRDYRFQSYKCPQNFVLPQITRPNECNKLASDSIITAKGSLAGTTNTTAAKSGNNKWSTVSDELQSNKLFVSSQIELLQAKEEDSEIARLDANLTRYDHSFGLADNIG